MEAHKIDSRGVFDTGRGADAREGVIVLPREAAAGVDPASQPRTCPSGTRGGTNVPSSEDPPTRPVTGGGSRHPPMGRPGVPRCVHGAGERSTARRMDVGRDAPVDPARAAVLLPGRRRAVGRRLAARQAQRAAVDPGRVAVPVLRAGAGGGLPGPAGLAPGLGHRTGAGRAGGVHHLVPGRGGQAGGRPGVAVHRPGPGQAAEHRGLDQLDVRHPPVERSDLPGVHQARRAHPHLRHPPGRQRGRASA